MQALGVGGVGGWWQPRWWDHKVKAGAGGGWGGWVAAAWVVGSQECGRWG